MDIIIRFPSETKVLRMDPVFSSWVNFNNKLFYKFKKLKSHLFFFFEFQKLKALEKKSVFFFSFLAFITFSQLLVGYVFK